MKHILLLFTFHLITLSLAQGATMNYDNVRQIQLDFVNGSVKVQAGSFDQVTLTHDSPDDCKAEVQQDDKILKLYAERNWFFNNSSCPLNIVLKVPRGLSIDIDQISGTQSFEGEFERIHSSLTSGFVESESLKLKDLELKMTSGKADLKVSPLENFKGFVRGISMNASMEFDQPVDVSFRSFAGKLSGPQSMINSDSAKSFRFKTVSGNLMVN